MKKANKNKWLLGKIAVVTGGASGIGLAMCKLMVQNGALVHMADIRDENLSDAVKALGNSVIPHHLDVADAKAMDNLAAEIIDTHGRVDILVNNAGVCIGGAFTGITREDWERSINVNVWGMLNGTMAFIPRMLNQSGSARVINMASAAGLMGIPYIAPYSATKAAIIAFSHSLAAELSGTAVKVTVACPGAVDTGLLEHSGFTLPGDWGDKVKRMMKNRGASPEKVAERILNAARRGKRCVFLAGGGLKPLWLLYRYIPWLYGVVVDHLGRMGKIG